MIGHWLLEPDTYARLCAGAHLEAAASAEQRAAFEALARRAPNPMTVSGDSAEIRIEGVLTARPDFLASLLGIPNTTYASIVDALASAETDPNVRGVVLAINSPGGHTEGLFAALAALEGFSKPIETRATLAASAAYALAARGGRITALGRDATFGSIGVAASIRVSDTMVNVTSTAAPNKRPDPRTAEGKAAIQAELDEVHALFAGEIAAARKTTVARVNAEFGRGGTLLADEAKRRGMIDAVLPAGAGVARGFTTMTTNIPRGPNQAAAEALAAQLGGASTPGTNESSTRFAERLFGGLEPKPAVAELSPAERVAAIVLGESRPIITFDAVTKRLIRSESIPGDPVYAPERPNSAASRVADIVVTELRKDRALPEPARAPARAKTIGEQYAARSKK